tara:strand:- start:68 stop:268 length:201 start_codon:yes stop_codon:yes gene_type:complete
MSRKTTLVDGGRCNIVVNWLGYSDGKPTVNECDFVWIHMTELECFVVPVWRVGIIWPEDVRTTAFE